MMQAFQKFICALGIPFWRYGSKCHQFYLSKGNKSWPAAQIPLIVIGSTLIGGAGRTQLTKALAQLFQKEGYKVLLLSLDFRSLTIYDDAETLKSVADHRIVKDRYHAWHDYANQYDLILSDGGLEDPRLKEAHKINLQRAYHKGWKDLFPLGRHRSLPSDHVQALVWNWCQECTMKAIVPEEYWLDGAPEVEIWSTLGDVEGFVELLPGVLVKKVNNLGDHNPHFASKLEAYLQENPKAKILISEKEAVKWKEKRAGVYIVTFEITLSPKAQQCILSFCL